MTSDYIIEGCNKNGTVISTHTHLHFDSDDLEQNESLMTSIKNMKYNHPSIDWFKLHKTVAWVGLEDENVADVTLYNQFKPTEQNC